MTIAAGNAGRLIYASLLGPNPTAEDVLDLLRHDFRALEKQWAGRLTRLFLLRMTLLAVAVSCVQINTLQLIADAPDRGQPREIRIR